MPSTTRSTGIIIILATKRLLRARILFNQLVTPYTQQVDGIVDRFVLYEAQSIQDILMNSAAKVHHSNNGRISAIRFGTPLMINLM